MTDTVKHMWDQVEKARADGTFSSEQAAVHAQDANGNGLRHILQRVHNVMVKDIEGGDDLLWTDEYGDLYRDISDALASARTPAACEQPDIDALAQFIRDAEREHGQCDDDDTYLSYRPTAKAILKKFDVRPK